MLCLICLCRNSRSVSKGAQWILYRSKIYDSLPTALADADLSVAMTRWLPNTPNCLPNLPALLQHPTVQQLLQQPLGSVSNPDQQWQHSQQEQGQAQVSTAKQQQQQQQPEVQHQRPVRVAVVFGREEFGLSDDEVSACDVACSIPIGRLQVSGGVTLCVNIQLYLTPPHGILSHSHDPAHLGSVEAWSLTA